MLTNTSHSDTLMPAPFQTKSKKVFAVMRKIYVLVSSVSFSVMQFSCVNNDTTHNESTALSEDEIVASIQAEGLTCTIQQSISALDENANARLSSMIQKNLTQEQFTQVVEDRKLNCKNDDTPVKSNPDIGVANQAITLSYFVERIEESSYQGSWGGSTVFRDGPVYKNMCGPDSDYIVEFHSIPNAYNNRSNLKITGLTSRGSCLLGWLGRHYTDSRVYSDNDIRSCIGYWGTVWCGGAPRSGDLWPHF